MKTVPDTDTFTLRDVVAVTGGTSLRQAFNRSIDACFDPVYGHISGSISSLKLSMFRNYHMLEVGDLWGGGVVASVSFNEYGTNIYGQTGANPTFQKVLICALNDSVRGVKWAKTPSGAVYTGYDLSSSLSLFKYALPYDSVNGTGLIIDNQGNTGAFAAKSARDYSAGGYFDWCLPSIYELKRIWDNMYWINTRQYGFMYSFDESTKYWSCTEAGRSTGGISVSHTFDSALSFNMVSEPTTIYEDSYNFMFYHITNRSLLLNVRPVRQAITGYFA